MQLNFKLRLFRWWTMVFKTPMSRFSCVVGMNPYNIVAGALTATLAVRFVSEVSKKFGGLVGWIAGFIVIVGATQAIKFGWAVANGTIRNGVDITWNWMPGLDFGVNYYY